jgi:DNA repair photolyase
VRWQAQALDAPDEGALPGLARIPGLLRSVRTPEFAGVTFHEVRARSVLNRVADESAVPFRWTVNPYRGCTHACVYCLSGDTPVLMADGRQRPLADLQVGDQVYGTVFERRRRRYVPTRVEAHWQTDKVPFRIVLADGTMLTASGDHRFLTTRGWQRVESLTLTDQFIGGGRLRRLPRHSRRLSLTGTYVTSEPGLKVVAIEPTGVTQPMYDITTGTGDFIADGVVSHNCFARGSHSWLELDTGVGFDTEIVVKVNAPDVLRRELGRLSWSREHVALGTNTDPYQRAEGRYQLMPGVIDALARSGTPFSVLTKGTLLRRDLPRLAAAAGDVDVRLAVSVAIYDDELHQALEPGAPSPRTRLELVRSIRAAGFDCAVLLAPVLPWLTDSAEHLDTAVAALADAGATSVTPIPLHLRPGAREWFTAWLHRERPELVARYRDLYWRGAYVPNGYAVWLRDQVDLLRDRHGLTVGPRATTRGLDDPSGDVSDDRGGEGDGPEQLVLI